MHLLTLAVPQLVLLLVQLLAETLVLQVVLLLVATPVHQTVQPLVVPATNLIRSGRLDGLNIPKLRRLVQAC